MQKNDFRTQILHPCAAGFLVGVAALLLPILSIRGEDAADQPQQLLPSPAPSQTAPAPSPAPSSEVPHLSDREETVCILMDDGSTEEMTLEEYLWRVVAAEMPASFEGEALRAQAVCARTYTLWKMAAGSHKADGADLCSSSACCQAYTTRKQAALRWKDLTEVYTERITAAVADTDGCILTYDGQPIQAVFFSSSVSSTEDAAEVWGSSVPYLLPVSTPEGEEVPNYHSTVTLTATELKALSDKAKTGAKLTGDPGQWVTEVTRSASGRVASLRLGGVTLPGTAVRSLLGLRSACFEVDEKNGMFTFCVTGYGHGVGMSQYGANAMAAEGAGWEEIVTHYYTGAVVEQRKNSP